MALTSNHIFCCCFCFDTTGLVIDRICPTGVGIRDFDINGHVFGVVLNENEFNNDLKMKMVLIMTMVIFFNGQSYSYYPTPRQTPTPTVHIPATAIEFNSTYTDVVLSKNNILEYIFGVANDIVRDMIGVINNENFYDNINGYYQLLHPTHAPSSAPTPQSTIVFNKNCIKIPGINVLKGVFDIGCNESMLDNEMNKEICGAMLIFSKFLFVLLFDLLILVHENLDQYDHSFFVFVYNF